MTINSSYEGICVEFEKNIQHRIVFYFEIAPKVLQNLL